MSSSLGTEQRPLRVAIVGSGPSGFYAAEALFEAEQSVKVDMFDRLPSPFGLVRYGVAPDHQKIKNVTKVYEQTASQDNFSFYGNVCIGKDMPVEKLKEFYDAVIFACGAENDNKLGIPGEGLAGSHTATEFIAWYNGHPDYRDRQFDLSREVAVIIGQGNVAMDVCRILSKTVDELKNTDMAQYALDALSKSKVREIHLIGRRGPVQAKFTPPEIREFGELADCDVIVDKEYLKISAASQKELENPANGACRKNFEILSRYAALDNAVKGKRIVIHFLKSPVELKGDKCLEKVILETNKLSGEPNQQKATGTGKTEELPCGLFFRSVGYRGLPIEGVPFDERKGKFPNKDGRILDKDRIVEGLYCAGWIKRGPTGIIGTNKPDSAATVRSLFADMDKLKPCPNPDTKAPLEFLEKKNVKVISFADWKKIDAAEIARGQKAGKPREKFITVKDMLAVVGK